MFRFLRTWLALCGVGFLLAACGGGSSDGDSANAKNRIYMLAAPSGQLMPGNSPQEWTLVLETTHPKAFWYEDRPGRSSGDQALADYVGLVWSKAYGDVEPHATLHFEQPGSTGLQSVYARVSQPVYDEKSRQLRVPLYILTNSESTPDATAVPASNLMLEVLNNADDDKEVASYVQYAEKGRIESTGTAGRYKLVLSDTASTTLMVDNAPGQYYDSRSTRDFSAQWNTFFAGNPPNAAIHGTTDSGDVRLFFFTLSNPQYDPVSASLTYDAVNLGNAEPSGLALSQMALNIDSGQFSRFPALGKGTAYQGLSTGYDPSKSIESRIYFGSDITRKQFGSLWGTQSYLKQSSCAPYCRDDLKTMKDMGINLVRVYDWDSRNDHKPFLDYAHSLGIKVIVSISNWLPCNPDQWSNGIPAYFNSRNFGTSSGSKRDWHPAIAGVTISNELDAGSGHPLSKSPAACGYANAVKLTAQFLQKAKELGFSNSMRVGIPVTFRHFEDETTHVKLEKEPAWSLFKYMLDDPALAEFKGQLMLNPNTYNDRAFLFGQNGQDGWVQKTYAEFKMPILFTEIGLSRVDSNAAIVVKDQLEGVLGYQKAHPEQLLGAIHFMFDNKVWKQTPYPETDSEGAFGTFRHGAVVKNMKPIPDDFEGVEGGLPPGDFNIDKLERTPTYDAVTGVYLNPEYGW